MKCKSGVGWDGSGMLNASPTYCLSAAVVHPKLHFSLQFPDAVSLQLPDVCLQGYL